MTKHSATYTRYSRGLTPIRPQRPLYGYRVRCTCGADWRVNDTKPEAIKSFKSHKERLDV